MHAFTAFSVLLCSFARIFTLSQENIYICCLTSKFDRCIVVIPCSFLKKNVLSIYFAVTLIRILYVPGPPYTITAIVLTNPIHRPMPFMMESETSPSLCSTL